MDYCHPCRRHLNGALACPGCGTPAEPIRASAPEATTPEPADTGEPPHPQPEFADDRPGGAAGGGDGDEGDE
ncbi:hypothetical protein AB0D38_42465, partial [Streptomyces sp. NPDC048279]